MAPFVGRSTTTAPTPRPVPSPMPVVGTVGETGLTGRDRRWVTRVEAVDGPTLVVVAPTRPRGPAILPDPGTEVWFGWSSDTEFHRAAGVLVGTGEDVVATWTFTVRSVVRQQRRSAFRLAAGLGLRLTTAVGDVDGVTRDLSEGGLRCVVPLGTRGEPGDRVEVSLPLPDDEPVAGTCEIVRRRVFPPTPVEPGRIELGLAFVDWDPHRTEILRRFVFAEQLRRRATG